MVAWPISPPIRGETTFVSSSVLSLEAILSASSAFEFSRASRLLSAFGGHRVRLRSQDPAARTPDDRVQGSLV